MPTETHTPEYDAEGRVLRVRVERESAWDDEQYQLMVALAEYESQVTENGFLVSDVTTKNADPDNPQGTHRFVAESVIDWSAYAVEAHLKSKGTEDPYRGARKVRVTRVER